MQVPCALPREALGPGPCRAEGSLTLRASRALGCPVGRMSAVCWEERGPVHSFDTARLAACGLSLCRASLWSPRRPHPCPGLCGSVDRLVGGAPLCLKGGVAFPEAPNPHPLPAWPGPACWWGSVAWGVHTAACSWHPRRGPGMRAPGRHRANRGGAGPGCVRSVTIKRILSGQGLVCVLSISGSCYSVVTVILRTTRLKMNWGFCLPSALNPYMR